MVVVGEREWEGQSLLKVDYLMRTVSVLIGIAACLAVARASTPEELVACPVSPNLRGHENIEWSIGYAFHLTDQNKDLPRVLLVGDSICNGYQGEVQKRLEGKMNVSYWASSYCVTSPGYLKLLDFYLSEARYDVIHFNNGCHSFDTSDADWEKGLRAALQLIRLRQPQAKLIWGMTTPNRNEARNLRVKNLNALAARVIDKFDGIAVDDLYAQMDSLDRKTQWRDDFHFVQSAISVQADVVSKICLESLKN